MSKITRYIYAILIIVGYMSHIGFAYGVDNITFNNIVDVSYTRDVNAATLKYTKTPDANRFIFEFNGDIRGLYSIKSDNKSTTITFYRTLKLNTINLTEFDKYSQITQRKLSNRSIQIVFPQPLKNSAEHLNSIILDLHEGIAEQLPSKPRNIEPLQISSLSFSWNSPVALAVFKRNKYLWIVFNQYQKINIDEMLQNAGSMVKDMIQLPHMSATILRLEASNDIFSEVRKEGLLWVVDLYNRKTERNAKDIKVSIDATVPNKPNIQVNLPRTEDVFSFLDPEIGDMLMAITSSEAGYAFFEGYKYPDFSFLPTSQGMAVNSDEFAIGIIRNNNGFVLQTLEHPMNLSQNLEIMKKQAELTGDETSVNISRDLSLPIIKKTFATSERFLIRQIKEAEEKNQNAHRLELARFYLSHALASNARSILRKIESDLEKREEQVSPRINSLIGVSELLLKRYDIAEDIFNIKELRENPEVRLWKALADTSENNDFTPDILSNIQTIRMYPTEVRKRVAQRGLEYAIQKENDILAQKLINLLREIPADDKLTAFINFYDAEKIRLQGYMRSATPSYKMAALSNSEKYSSLARFKIAEINSQMADIKPARIIQELDRLKFAWGEKNFKINVLNKLVDLHLKDNNFYMALQALKEIGLLSSKQKDAIEQRMLQIMEEIYYYNNDNQFSPIKALALFEDFGSLVALSPYETAITIKLADRLVAIDLLDRAYNLLYDYLKVHKDSLSHKQISAIGGRLALINLFNNDENNALKILKETEHYDIPQTILLQRKIIKAQALSKKGETKEALKLLENDNSRNAILLKTDIYWNAQMWNEASNSLRLLIEKPKGEKDLSVEQVYYILDWLTALKLAGKEAVIVRVKNTFKPYFDKSPYHAMFNMLTDNLENDKISINDIRQTIQNVRAYSDFTKQYIDSLRTNNLTEDNATQ